MPTIGKGSTYTRWVDVELNSWPNQRKDRLPQIYASLIKAILSEKILMEMLLLKLL